MIKFFSIFLSLTLITVTGTAQTSAEKKVAEAVEAMRNAMIEKDTAALDRLTDARLSYGHSTGKVENKHAFIESIKTGKSDFVSITLSDQIITLSAHVAIVRHVLDASTNDSGHSGVTKLKVLLVFIEEKGQWKLLARQAVKFT